MGLIRKFSVRCDFCNNCTDEHYSEERAITDALDRAMIHMDKPFRRKDNGEIDWDVKWACVNSDCQEALAAWELDSEAIIHNGELRINEDKLLTK